MSINQARMVDVLHQCIGAVEKEWLFQTGQTEELKGNRPTHAGVCRELHESMVNAKQILNEISESSQLARYGNHQMNYSIGDVVKWEQPAMSSFGRPSESSSQVQGRVISFDRESLRLSVWIEAVPAEGWTTLPTVAFLKLVGDKLEPF